jgi:hypothetical protein
MTKQNFQKIKKNQNEKANYYTKSFDDSFTK